MDKRVSIKSVIAKIYRTIGDNRELNFDDCVEWIAEALSYIGAFRQFNPKIVKKDLIGGKIPLPCDFHKIIYITYNNIPLSWATNAMNTAYSCDDCKIPDCCTEYTFYINDNFIITSLDSETICIEYLAIPTDEEGYPTVPDEVYYTDACAMFVIKMLDWQDWRRGIIPDKVKDDSEMRWNEKVQAARAAGNMPNLAQLENLKNVYQRLIPLNNEFALGFKNLSKQEQKYRQ